MTKKNSSRQFNKKRRHHNSIKKRNLGKKNVWFDPMIDQSHIDLSPIFRLMSGGR